MNTRQLYWFTPMSYIRSSPNPRWNSLNHNSKKHKHHCSWTLLVHYFSTYTLREILSRRVYNHTFTRNEMWNEYSINAEICLKPVEQIAWTTPLTKLWNQTRTSTLLIFEIFQEQMLILCKSLILWCKTCFLNCMIDV